MALPPFIGAALFPVTERSIVNNQFLLPLAMVFAQEELRYITFIPVHNISIRQMD